MTPELRGYQEQAIYAARMHFAQGKRSVLLVSPTGSGKTTIGAHIAAGHIAKGGRVLWVAHRRELVDQAAKRLREYQLDVAVWPCNGTASVVVASIQSLLATEDKPLATLVILDEAHHYVSDGWSQEMSAYADCHKIGLTATPARGDGVGLGNAFDALHVVTTIKTLTDAGHLVPLEIIAPSAALDGKHIAQCPIDAYETHARGMFTVIFAANLEMANKYQSMMRERSYVSHIIHHKMSRADRTEMLRAHIQDKIPLINVGILTEGWDSPSTECIILARTCGSQSLYTQIAGRILRPHIHKNYGLLIDLHGSCHRLGRPDEDKVYSLEGRGIRRTTDTDVKFCPICGAVLDIDREDCVDCGYIRPDYKPPVVTNDPLIKYARKRAETAEERAKTVIRWIVDAKAKGYNMRSVFGKYAHVYGDSLSGDMFKSCLTQARATNYARIK